MKCPVCQLDGITDLHPACPSCGASLTAFRMIDELDDQYREVLRQRLSLEGDLSVASRQASSFRRRSRRFLTTSLLLGLVALWLWFYKQRPVVQQVQQVVRCDSLDYYKNALDTYRMRSPREILYVIRENDVLEDLGMLFYNQKAAGYKIGQDNGITNKADRRQLHPGDTLRIRYW